MARPKKSRRICSEPEVRFFEPVQGEEALRMKEQQKILEQLKLSQKNSQVEMTIDEYECIRLMDYEGFSQQECALRMNVARTTVTMMYDSARKKMAKCLVEGCTLVISGGNYVLCDGSAKCHAESCEGRKHCAEQETI